MRRPLEVVISGLALVVLSPLLLAIALCVLIDGGRPVIFRQQRVGRGGRLFHILKFRTMAVVNEGSLVTATDDPRITSSGRWLRSTKCDELPQLWNVLRGDLSLVGPRPEVPQYVDLWPPEDRDVILSVRPGITDPASLKYRREAEMLAAQPVPEAYYRCVILPDKVNLYREYVEHQSLLSDLRIIGKSLKAVAAS